MLDQSALFISLVRCLRCDWRQSGVIFTSAAAIPLCLMYRKDHAFIYLYFVRKEERKEAPINYTPKAIERRLTVDAAFFFYNIPFRELPDSYWYEIEKVFFSHFSFSRKKSDGIAPMESQLFDKSEKWNFLIMSSSSLSNSGWIYIKGSSLHLYQIWSEISRGIFSFLCLL